MVQRKMCVHAMSCEEARKTGGRGAKERRKDRKNENRRRESWFFFRDLFDRKSERNDGITVLAGASDVKRATNRIEKCAPSN